MDPKPTTNEHTPITVADIKQHLIEPVVRSTAIRREDRPEGTTRADRKMLEELEEKFPDEVRVGYIPVTIGGGPFKREVTQVYQRSGWTGEHPMPARKEAGIARVVSPKHGEAKVPSIGRIINDLNAAGREYHFTPSPQLSREAQAIRASLQAEPDLRERILRALTFVEARDRQIEDVTRYYGRITEARKTERKVTNGYSVRAGLFVSALSGVIQGWGSKLDIGNDGMVLHVPGVGRYNKIHMPWDDLFRKKYYFIEDTAAWLDRLMSLLAKFKIYPKSPIGLLRVMQEGDTDPLAFLVVSNPSNTWQEVDNTIGDMRYARTPPPSMPEELRLIDLIS